MRFVILIVIATLLLGGGPVQAAGKPGSVYDRVMKTGTIRCGYLVWPPFLTLDSATGRFGGMNYDYVEAVGAALGLKIDWALEVSPGDQVAALQSGKIDAMCAAEGPMVPSTIKYIHYSTPLAYFPFYLYARADDRHFDKGLAGVNDPAVRIAVIDGDMSGILASLRFPQAARHALPQMAAPGQMMMDVAGNKADIVINDPLSMSAYFAANPGVLARVNTNGPLAVVPNTLSVLRGVETREFLELLNQGIENVRHTGREAEIFARYQKPGDGYFFPVRVTY